MCFSLDLLEVEHVAVEVREDVPLEELLLAVEGELLGADGTDLPVALHVLLEAALLEVRREDHLAQRAALVDVTPGEGEKDAQECEENDSLGDCSLFLDLSMSVVGCTTWSRSRSCPWFHLASQIDDRTSAEPRQKPLNRTNNGKR